MSGARWLRANPLATAAVAFGLVIVAVIFAVTTIRSRATWRERARIADSTAKATQKDRARVLAKGRADSSLAVALGVSVQRLTRSADSAAQRARDATGTARAYRVARDAAIARLGGATTPGDSVSALVAKSHNDDEMIAAQESVIRERVAETTLLRTALDSANTARFVLSSSLDSARVQLRRDGQVIQQLQAAVRSARPTSPPRFSKLALTAGVGYCAAPSLTPRLCGFAGAGPSLRLF